MKIRQIKAFLAIVSTGGVRPAAKKLCLTPSTVAKSIGQLESDLGAPLFERSALSLRLNAAAPPSSSSSRAAFSQTAELSALVEEPLFEVDHGIVAAPGHPVLAPDADLKTVFAQSEWLTTVQDEGFLLEKLGGLGISPERVTLCDFFGIDALKGRNDALTLSPLSVIEDSLYAGRLDALHPALFPLSPLTVSFFHRKAVEPSPPADFMRHALRLAFAQWMAAKPRRFIRARWRPTRSLMFLGINSTFETIFKRNGNKFQLT